jgi:hypothetical protein
MGQQFTEEQIISFGNFLLSAKRKKSFTAKAISLGLHKQVNHADLENWKHAQDQRAAQTA